MSCLLGRARCAVINFEFYCTTCVKLDCFRDFTTRILLLLRGLVSRAPTFSSKWNVPAAIRIRHMSPLNAHMADIVTRQESSLIKCVRCFTRLEHSITCQFARETDRWPTMRYRANKQASRIDWLKIQLRNFNGFMTCKIVICIIIFTYNREEGNNS